MLVARTHQGPCGGRDSVVSVVGKVKQVPPRPGTGEQVEGFDIVGCVDRSLPRRAKKESKQARKKEERKKDRKLRNEKYLLHFKQCVLRVLYYVQYVLSLVVVVWLLLVKRPTHGATNHQAPPPAHG